MSENTQPMNLPMGGHDSIDGGADRMYVREEVYGPARPTIRQSCQNKSLMGTLGCWMGQSVYRVGESISNNWSKILMTFLVFFALYMIVMFLGIIAEAEVVEAEASMLGAAASYANAAYHKKCKTRGGCCKSCPFISEADPRVVIGKQADSLDVLYEQTRQSVEDDRELIFNSIGKVLEGERKTKETEWNGFVDVEANANNAIKDLVYKVKLLDAAYSNSDNINVSLIDAKNCAIALGAAAVIQKNILIIASLQLNSQIMIDRVNVIQKENTTLEESVTKCFEAAKELTGIYEKAGAWTNKASAYGVAYDALTSPTKTQEDVISGMAAMLQLANESEKTVTNSIAKFSTVSHVFHKCKQSESFSNALPGKLDSDRMTAMIQGGDFSGALVQTALEPDIVSNHLKFSKERSSFESGGGIPSVRDDDNDIVPWVGLFGRPTYRRSNGLSADTPNTSGMSIGSIPSDNPNLLMRPSSYSLNGVKTY